jgi:predicted membrane metal-binding protein
VFEPYQLPTQLDHSIQIICINLHQFASICINLHQFASICQLVPAAMFALGPEVALVSHWRPANLQLGDIHISNCGVRPVVTTLDENIFKCNKWIQMEWFLEAPKCAACAAD